MKKFLKTILLATLIVRSTSVFSNVVGTDFQLFNPSSDGKDFVTVNSTSMLGEGILNIGLFADYATNIVGAKSKKPGDIDWFSRSGNDSLIETHLGTSYGFSDSFQLGASLPFVVDTKLPDNLHEKVAVEENGVTQIRFNGKYFLLTKDNLSFATIATIGFETIDSNPLAGGPLSISVEGAMNIELGNFLLGINGGVKFRSSEVVSSDLTSPIGNQFLLSSAISYRVRKWSFVAEAYMAQPFSYFEHDLDRARISSEVQLATKREFSKSFNLIAGVSSEIVHGIGSTDVRGFMGINILSEIAKPRDKSAALEEMTKSGSKSKDLESIMLSIDELKKRAEPTPPEKDELFRAQVTSLFYTLKEMEFEKVTVANYYIKGSDPDLTSKVANARTRYIQIYLKKKGIPTDKVAIEEIEREMAGVKIKSMDSLSGP